MGLSHWQGSLPGQGHWMCLVMWQSPRLEFATRGHSLGSTAPCSVEFYSGAAQASLQAPWLCETRDHAQQLDRATGLTLRPASTIGCALWLPRFSDFKLSGCTRTKTVYLLSCWSNTAEWAGRALWLETRSVRTARQLCSPARLAAPWLRSLLWVWHMGRRSADVWVLVAATRHSLSESWCPAGSPGDLFEASETRMGLAENAFRSVGKGSLGSRFPTGETESRGGGGEPLRAMLCGPGVGATESDCNVPLGFQCSPSQSLWSRECFSLTPALLRCLSGVLLMGDAGWSCVPGAGWGSRYVTTLLTSLWRGCCRRSSWGTGGKLLMVQKARLMMTVSAKTKKKQAIDTHNSMNKFQVHYAK